jgi:hypothetical protein
MSKGYPLTDGCSLAVHSSCRVFAAILLLVVSSAKAASTVASMEAQPMELAHRSTAVAASTSIREALDRACWQPASRPHHALSFQRRRSCVRTLAQRTTPTVTMTTMAAMMMMTAMRYVAAPDLSRPHYRCRYRLAVRPLDPPPIPTLPPPPTTVPLTRNGGSVFSP